MPKADDAAYIRSLVGSLVATHASFLARDSVQVSHKIKIKIKIKIKETQGSKTVYR